MNGCAPGANSPSASGNAGSLTGMVAESIRTPATPRSNQNRSTSVCSRRTSGWFQFRSGCCGANRCRYHSPGVPSGFVVRVQVPPEKLDTQSVGGSSPSGPRPGWNQNRCRSGDPGPAASAARNHSCWSDTWLGTMSTIVRMPSAAASAINSSASSTVPNAGSITR